MNPGSSSNLILRSPYGGRSILTPCVGFLSQNGLVKCLPVMNISYVNMVSSVAVLAQVIFGHWGWSVGFLINSCTFILQELFFFPALPPLMHQMAWASTATRPFVGLTDLDLWSSFVPHGRGSRRVVLNFRAAAKSRLLLFYTFRQEQLRLALLLTKFSPHVRRFFAVWC